MLRATAKRGVLGCGNGNGVWRRAAAIDFLQILVHASATLTVQNLLLDECHQTA